MADSLKIAFLASEATPFAKTGGLADVAGALPAELCRSSHDARLFLPLYANVNTAGLDLVPEDSIRDVTIEMGWHRHRFSALRTELASGLPVFLIDCPELFHRESIYTSAPDEPLRFTLFCRAVIESCQRIGWGPDVIHCNDWHTALVPLLLRTVYDWDALFRETRTLLTIHNVGYQGLFPRELVDEIGMGQWYPLFDQDDLAAGRVGFLRTGMIYANKISTVSPTYAREIQSEEYGMGLDGLLRARRADVVGILNGVDYGEWSPETDRFIPHPFSADDLDGKQLNKTYLLDKMGLSAPEGVPLIGIVSRLAHQKGFDLCADVLPDLLGRFDARLVVLGSGEERYEEVFSALQRQSPGTVCFHRGYHDELAHVIEAASDMILMPSRYEPCGLNQMFGLRYGTLPVVRRTGGLADSVEQVDPVAGTGTGFVFDHFTADGLHWALGQALESWSDQDLWRRWMRNAMRQDFSWQRQVRPYLDLYASMKAG